MNWDLTSMCARAGCVRQRVQRYFIFTVKSVTPTLIKMALISDRLLLPCLSKITSLNIIQLFSEQCFYLVD